MLQRIAFRYSALTSENHDAAEKTEEMDRSCSNRLTPIGPGPGRVHSAQKYAARSADCIEEIKLQSLDHQLLIDVVATLLIGSRSSSRASRVPVWGQMFTNGQGRAGRTYEVD